MKKRILIADNSKEFCHQLVRSLKNYEELEVVGTANDGEQTLRMVKEKKPDMLVLDLLLPKLDGIGVLKEIYSIENRPIVIATSGFITDYLASVSDYLGIRYLILKPCDIDSLAEVITDYLIGTELQKTRRENTAMKIEDLVANILSDIGVPAHIKGYHYLREALIIVAKDMDVLNALTKVLYPQIARTFQTTSSGVVRALRYAVEIAWNRRDQNGLDRFFGTTVSKRSDKITVKEFLRIISDDIRSTLGMKI